MAVRTRMFGRWAFTEKVLKSAPKALSEDINDVMNKCGEMILREIDRCIDTGGYGTWPPLSESWEKRKTGSGFYKDKGVLLNNFNFNFTHKGPIRYRMYAGLRPGATHYSELGAEGLLDVLETERPIFEIVWTRVGNRVNSLLKKVGGKVFR